MSKPEIYVFVSINIEKSASSRSGSVERVGFNVAQKVGNTCRENPSGLLV